MTRPVAPPATPRSSALRPLAILSLLLAAAFVAALACTRLGSVDLGYHIAYGREFLRTGHIVDRDPFLYGSAGQRFVNANWASQVLIALAAARLDGLALQALAAALVALTFAGVAILAWRRGCGLPALAVTLLLAAVAAYERLGLRPELFSYLWLVAAALLLTATPRRGLVAVGLAALLQVAWVNTHSYFLVAPLLTAATLLGDWVDARRAGRGGPTTGSRRRTLVAILLVQLVTSLANPWGLSGAAFPLRTLAVLRAEGTLAGGPDRPAPGGPWSAISEFHPPLRYVGYSIAGRTIDAYVVLLSVAAAGALAAVVRRRTTDALVILLLAAMSLTLRRNIAQFALVAAPLAVAALHAWLRDRPASLALRRGATATLLMASISLAAFWLAGLWTGRFYAAERRSGRSLGAGFEPGVFPRAACDWIAAHPALRPRLFADFYSASNVLPALPAGWQVYVHTNTFAYPSSALATLQDICRAAQPYAPFFAQQQVNLVLLHAGEESKPLIAHLAADAGWALAYVDPAYVLFVRRIPEHAAIVAGPLPTAASLDVDAWIAAATRRTHVRAGFELSTAAGVPLALGWAAPAARLLERAVALEPDQPEAWLNLGVSAGQLAQDAARRADAAEMRRRLERARECFRRALALRPDAALADIARHNLDLAERTLAALALTASGRG
ncbi:MAG: hypothetical protein U1A27_09170 [Phycisphaerae bacterium]